MKYDFTDNELELAAKKVLENLTRVNKAEMVKIHDDKVVNISAGESVYKVRKTISRTIRIYIVAAIVVMGVAGTLIMGAIHYIGSDKIDFSYTQKAYMCVNNDVGNEKNMPVTVTIDFEKTGDYIISHKNVGPVFGGDIIIKDMKGNIIAGFYDIELKYNQDKGYGFYDEYKTYRLENGGQVFIDQIDPDSFSALNIKFSNEWQSFVIFYYDKMTTTGDRGWTYSLEDCIFLVSDADSRADAIEKVYEYHKKECSECADLGDQGHIK